MTFKKLRFYLLSLFLSFALTSCWEPIEVHFYKYSFFNEYSHRILHTFDLNPILGDFSDRDSVKPTDEAQHLTFRKSWLFCFNRSYIVDMRRCVTNLKNINPSLNASFEISGVAAIPFPNEAGYIVVAEVQSEGYFSLLSVDFKDDHLELKRLSFNKKLLTENQVDFEFISGGNSNFHRLFVEESLNYKTFVGMLTDESPLFAGEKNYTVSLYPKYPAQLDKIKESVDILHRVLSNQNCKKHFLN